MTTTVPQTLESVPPEAVAFPILNERQQRVLRDVGETITAEDGEILIRAGDTGFDLYLVLEGALRIVERAPEQINATGEAAELFIARHTPGAFSGDVDLVTGRPAVFTAICEGHCKLVRVECGRVRQLVSGNAELGEIILRALIARRRRLAETGYHGTRLVGSRWSRDVFTLRDLLNRNSIPHTWIDPEQDADVDGLLSGLGVTADQLPLVICPSGELLRKPSPTQLAEVLGLRPRQNGNNGHAGVWDLVVVGAGPAGLAAAVYAASEGLKTLVVDAEAPGGQAATSSRIENYLGFPTGISGGDLADRAIMQAQKFGAVIQSPRRVTGITCGGGVKELTFEDGGATARAVLVAVGVGYRKLKAAGRERFEGAGIYYSATPMEAELCGGGGTVIVVGGGNSAGQAAVFLAGRVKRVILMVRSGGLAETMSRYLIDRIERTPNLELWTHSEITAFHAVGEMDGDNDGLACSNSLGGVTVRTSPPHGDHHTRPLDVCGVFIMIGADPRTDWVGDAFLLDDKGMIPTGHDVAALYAARGEKDPWPLDRPRYLLETSCPGVFAAGDVRAGSTKRVGTAVGDGAMAVRFVHTVLAT